MFRKAGIPLKVDARPIHDVGEDAVFQMDIENSGDRKKERFRIYPGHEENNVQVIHASRADRQVVLLVHEPKRAFTQRVDRGTIERARRVAGETWVDALLADSGLSRRDVLSAGKSHLHLRRFTPEFKRHYLVGYDETGRSGFIAQLPGHASTVRQAQESLKGSDVRDAERRSRGKTVRQGEWFFVAPASEELDRLRDALASHHAAVERRIGVDGGTGPRAHVADERVSLFGSVYVRGKVRHPDHATVRFRSWVRVFRNQEPAGDRGGPGPAAFGGAANPRVFWVD
jgi:hypothetical protein